MKSKYIALHMFSFILALSAPVLASKLDKTLADVKFKNTSYYIRHEYERVVETNDNNDKFSVCDQKGQCAAISNCTYSEKALSATIAQIEDPVLQEDVSWIFFRSDHSTQEFEAYYEFFVKILNKTKSNCDVFELETIKQILSGAFDTVGHR